MTMLRPKSDTPARGAVPDDVDIGRDRQLTTRAQQGDRSAFDDLYVRYYQRLWRFCLKRLGDEHEAEDIAQEAFVRAWQALPGFGGERRFYPWLSVIAAHLCTNVIRKRNRAGPVGELRERHLASWENSGEEQVMVAHEWELAARAFAQLSSRHRAVLELREERGWSYRRIAEHEGIGLTAVESVLWRAREALKREFEAQATGARLAGVAGAVLLAARRLLRGSQALTQQGASMTPSATSLAIGSATAAAATAVAAVITTLGCVAGPPAVPAAAAASAPTSMAAGQLPLLADLHTTGAPGQGDRTASTELAAPSTAGASGLAPLGNAGVGTDGVAGLSDLSSPPPAPDAGAGTPAPRLPSVGSPSPLVGVLASPTTLGARGPMAAVTGAMATLPRETATIIDPSSALSGSQNTATARLP